MKVLIEDNIYVESDSNQFIIKKYNGKLDDKGNEVSSSLSFHNTLEQVINKLYRMKINESTAANLKELLADHKRIQKEIKSLFE